MMKGKYEERISELSTIISHREMSPFQAQMLELSSVYCFLLEKNDDILKRTIFYQVYEETLKRLSPQESGYIYERYT